MEKLLKEIQEGIKEYAKYNNNYSFIKGKGSKAYITKRIDILREELLQIKKDLK